MKNPGYAIVSAVFKAYEREVMRWNAFSLTPSLPSLSFRSFLPPFYVSLSLPTISWPTKVVRAVL